jgi:hypothetical protein
MHPLEALSMYKLNRWKYDGHIVMNNIYKQKLVKGD